MKYKFIFNNESFECAKSLDGLSNVIEAIHWRYGNEIASVTGCNGFAKPDSDDFIPFEELTEANVISWLQSSNNMDELDLAVDNEIAQIEAKSNQEILPPPFES